MGIVVLSDTRPDKGVRGVSSFSSGGGSDRCRLSTNQEIGKVTEAGVLSQEGAWQEQGSALV